MDNVNDSDIQDSDVSENGSSKKRQATPVLSLTDAFAFVDKINKQLGSHAYHSNQAIAEASGLAVPTIRQPLSTCQQYGLLELKHGIGYKPTALFESLLYPKDDNEKRSLSIQSLKHSWVFKDLIDLFEGKQVPVLTGVQNTIVRDLGIKEVEKANKIANIFFDNIRSVKLINDKGILITTSKPDNISEKPKDETPKVEPPRSSKGITDVEDIEIKIPLKGRPKDALLIVPRDYKDSDLVRIIKFVDALKNDDVD